MFFGGMWFSWLFWIVLFALIIWLIVNMSNRSQKNSDSDSAKETPLDILKKRYATGEIDKKEFEEKKKDLIKGYLK